MSTVNRPKSYYLRLDINSATNQVSASAKLGDHLAYAVAVRRLAELKKELVDAQVTEAAKERAEKAAEAASARFKAETGYNSPGEMLVSQLTTDQSARHDAIRAERHAAIAEALYAPQPTPAELGAAALEKARQQAIAARIEAQRAGDVRRLAANDRDDDQDAA